MEIAWHQAPDGSIVRLESLSGMLTKIKTEDGGTVRLVEHPDCDGNRTMRAARLGRAPRHHFHSIDEELTDHVNEKSG